MTSEVPGDGAIARRGVWAFGGLVAAWLLLAAVFWLDVAVDVLLPGTPGLGTDVAVSALQVVIVAVTLTLALKAARSVVDVPRSVWLGPIALAAYALIVGVAAYVPGYYAPLRSPIVLTLGLLSAWVIDYLRGRSSYLTDAYAEGSS